MQKRTKLDGRFLAMYKITSVNNARDLIQVMLYLVVSLFCYSSSYAKEHIVEVITDNDNGIMAFSPKHLKVEQGDTVTWVNQVKDYHNVITYPDGYPKGSSGFVSPYLSAAGDKWSYTFSDAGTYEYHCIPHVLMGMRGTVVVEFETNHDEFHQPSIQEINEYRDEILRFFDEEEIEIMPEVVKRNIQHK
jgi:plastocyanin